MDVLVIGAGAAGLACARELRAKDLEVVVVEARDRPGGRIATLHGFVSEPFELGAMFVHGERASVLEVVREAGLNAVPPPVRSGATLFIIDGEIRTAAEVLREAGIDGLWAIETEVASLNGHDHPLTEELVARGWPPLRRILACEMFAQIWCADPQRLSAAGVTRVEGAWASGGNNYVVREGYDAVVRHLARDLEIELGNPVSELVWSPERVRARTHDRTFQARSCVVTVPPAVVASGDLRIDPELPAPKRDAAEAIPLGSVIRVAARLSEPAPTGGSVMMVGVGGGFWWVGEGQQLVTGWIGGPAAVGLSGVSALDLVDRLRVAFDWLRPELVEDVVLVDWGRDPWARGAYSYPVTGALDAPQRWAAPVDRTLFFAGEATCGDRHPATVHGAMESGRRAADEVAAALGC